MSWRKSELIQLGLFGALLLGVLSAMAFFQAAKMFFRMLNEPEMD